jgi:FtsH-binding integral membrane protein
MKHLAIYAIVIIALSALALSGNKAFYILASAYQYLIYGVVGVVAVVIVAYGFIEEKN